MIRLWLKHRLLDSVINNIGERLISNFCYRSSSVNSVNIGDKFTRIVVDDGRFTTYLGGCKITSIYYDHPMVYYNLTYIQFEQFDSESSTYSNFTINIADKQPEFVIVDTPGSKVEFFK